MKYCQAQPIPAREITKMISIPQSSLKPMTNSNVIFPFTLPFLQNKKASTLSAGTDSGISCRWLSFALQFRQMDQRNIANKNQDDPKYSIQDSLVYFQFSDKCWHIAKITQVKFLKIKYSYIAEPNSKTFCWLVSLFINPLVKTFYIWPHIAIKFQYLIFQYLIFN